MAADDDDWRADIAAGAALLNEAIRYASQVAAIGVDGLLDTFLPERREQPPEQCTASEMTGPSDGMVIT